jgi:hypothetical protein
MVNHPMRALEAGCSGAADGVPVERVRAPRGSIAGVSGLTGSWRLVPVAQDPPLRSIGRE